jgi:hypothetical protein
VSDESPSISAEIESAWVPRIIDISEDPIAQHLLDLAEQFWTSRSGKRGGDTLDYDSPVSE